MLYRLSLKIFLLLFVGITACYYDVEEELYQGNLCLTNNITYQSNIRHILQRNCYVCHGVVSNTSSINLEGYDKLIVYVNNGKLLGALRHESGYQPMPQGAPKLNDCDIARIQQWIIDGSRDN